MADEVAVRPTDERVVAPYLPFKTFLSAFDVFEHGTPHKVDRSLWRNQSGVIQGQIVMALRFFRLIDENDAPHPALDRFIANKDKWKEFIGVLLHASYQQILDRDLTKMTPKLLSEEMDAYGLTGDTKRKATVFFLQAVRFAELPMHPLLQTQTRLPTSNGSRKKRKVQSGNVRQSEIETPTLPPSPDKSGETKSVRLKSGAVITLKISANWLELPPEERKYVFELIDLLQSPSVAATSGDEGAP
jgi:hypothetical protein